MESSLWNNYNSGEKSDKGFTDYTGLQQLALSYRILGYVLLMHVLHNTHYYREYMDQNAEYLDC